MKRAGKDDSKQNHLPSLVLVKTYAKLHLLKFKNHKRNINQYYQSEKSTEVFLLKEEQSLQMLAAIILSLLTAAKKVLVYSEMFFSPTIPNTLVLFATLGSVTESFQTNTTNSRVRNISTKHVIYTGTLNT